MGKFLIQPVKTGYTFHLKANNGEVIATSQPYTTLASCKHGVESVMHTVPKANLEDQTAAEPVKEKNPKFELYKDKGDKFRFHLKASNGEIIAASGAYKEKSGCVKGIESVRKNAPDATVVVEENAKK